MISTTIAQLLFAGLAALFAFLSIVVGLLKWKWDTADSELKRERKLERRFVGQSITVEYEKEDMPRRDARLVESALGVESGNITEFDRMLDDGTEYDSEVTEILVTEHSGLRYGLSKLWSGFDGKTEVTVGTWERSGLDIGGKKLLPPDIEQFSNFDSKVDINEDESEIVINLDTADESGVEKRIEAIFTHVQSEFGETTIDWDYPNSCEGA